jgi:uncharacterized protein (TIGR02118 family)
MSYQLTVIYNQPEDPEAFDSYYEQTHAPLTATMPGLRSYTASKPEPGPGGEAPGAYLVATLQFADKSAFGAAVASDEGRRSAKDVRNFATGGVTMFTGEVTTYVPGEVTTYVPGD